MHARAADDIVEVFRHALPPALPAGAGGDRALRTTPTRRRRATATAPGAFVCRPTTGASYFSQHAYGLAIDLNTFQNPYLKGDVVLPELASAYLRTATGSARA